MKIPLHLIMEIYGQTWRKKELLSGLMMYILLLMQEAKALFWFLIMFVNLRESKVCE